jgi:hypothetical protein
MRQWIQIVLSCACALLAADLFAADKVEGMVNSAGGLELKFADRLITTMQAGLYEKGWKGASATAGSKFVTSDKPERKFIIKAPSGAIINGDAKFAEENGAVKASYDFTPAGDIELNSLHVSADIEVPSIQGGKWMADDKSGRFPDEYKDTHLFNGAIKSLTLQPLTGPEFTITFAQPTNVLIQDNRQWGPTFSIRIGPASNEKKYTKADTVKIAFTLAANTGVALDYDKPVTLTAGTDWIPLKLDLDIEAGSALDFSGFGFQDAPAGKFGRVIARKDGQFAFEKDPDTARRFYGVNFCFSAQYMSHEDSDKVADRLARLGYNAVRIHHYEGELISKQANSTTLNPEKLDQLDYLLAAFSKRGIYTTTDLFVSRGVPWKELGVNKPGNVEMDTYKILVPVMPAAYENWKAFSKALLDHTNPYTKLRNAEDPSIAWLSMINEGMFGNFMDRVRKVPEWTTAWNAWLAKQYPTRDALTAVWKKELKDNEDPAKGTVELPANIYAGGPRVMDCHSFFAATDREMIVKMKAFLRDELKCTALVTNSNAWTNFLTDQSARTVYDYVDDHFYIDHPHFLEQDWRLPSSCPNTSPISSGASGGRTATFTRLFDKPFTITEYNYSAPGKYRGVGGILTGAMGALQGWGGIWRFAYSHGREANIAPARMDYFNMATDPLGQASERATLCLFMRGDMKAAPHSVGVVMTEKEALNIRPVPRLAPNWHWMGWITRVGTQVIDEKAPPTLTAALPIGDDSRAAAGKTAEDLKPYAIDNPKLMELMKKHGIVSDANTTDPAKQVYRSETGEITIDAPHNTMLLDTPRTAGGYAPAGQTMTTADKSVSITIQEADATVWVSALDKEPIATSKRLLVSHLTDLQNTDIKYAELARKTLLDWGKLPHLVRNGKATVFIKSANADALKVWALSTSGKRIGEVEKQAAPGGIQFTADVGKDAVGGARMMYEIAVP